MSRLRRWARALRQQSLVVFFAARDPQKGVEVRGRHWRDIRGDKVALKDYPSAGFEPMGVPANPMFERGCEISRVVPMARD